MKKDHLAASAGAPRPEDYDRGELPIKPPERSLRSFGELAAIEYARDVFYDERGAPNELWRRFADTFSLHAFKQPNANSAAPGVLSAFGVEDPTQEKKLGEFLRGESGARFGGRNFFKNAAEVASVLGAQSPAAGKLGTEISALRVTVTVREGIRSYQLATVIATRGDASAAELAPETSETEPDSKGDESKPTTATDASKTDASKTLNYPFTVLEIRENDVSSAAD
jgi:general secretion pathway protein K